jgi:hypothetical protein
MSEAREGRERGASPAPCSLLRSSARLVPSKSRRFASLRRGRVAPSRRSCIARAGALAPRAGAVAPRAGAVAPHAGADALRAGVVAPRAGAVAPRAGAVAPRAGVVAPGLTRLNLGKFENQPFAGPLFAAFFFFVTIAFRAAAPWKLVAFAILALSFAFAGAFAFAIM